MLAHPKFQHIYIDHSVGLCRVLSRSEAESLKKTIEFSLGKISRIQFKTKNPKSFESDWPLTGSLLLKDAMFYLDICILTWRRQNGSCWLSRNQRIRERCQMSEAFVCFRQLSQKMLLPENELMSPEKCCGEGEDYCHFEMVPFLGTFFHLHGVIAFFFVSLDYTWYGYSLFCKYKSWWISHYYITESSWQLDLSGAFVESWWLQGVILGGYVEVILEFSDPYLADRRTLGANLRKLGFRQYHYVYIHIYLHINMTPNQTTQNP